MVLGDDSLVSFGQFFPAKQAGFLEFLFDALHGTPVGTFLLEGKQIPFLPNLP